ncbi:hypothetical protein ARMGADRAFT_1073944 [Armillaria gallica]|uniref:Thioester reductase (TE) domain-containing protein n=1 Tax=Armillaria gallica TaxID=47427 RepID=A0A2H3DUZ1_ARMGA|nr:hypothetical protein ARMGADRAFT_1073944 [Armillaria gallica]
MDPASAENPLQVLLKRLEADEVDALAKQCGMAQGLESVDVLDAVRSQALQMEEDAKVLHSKIARIENGTLRSELTAFARPPRDIDGSRFWAVLIGIDGYSTNPLRGCVADALEINDYLLNDLGVPKDRIQYFSVLLANTATTVFLSNTPILLARTSSIHLAISLPIPKSRRTITSLSTSPGTVHAMIILTAHIPRVSSRFAPLIVMLGTAPPATGGHPTSATERLTPFLAKYALKRDTTSPSFRMLKKLPDPTADVNWCDWKGAITDVIDVSQKKTVTTMECGKDYDQLLPKLHEAYASLPLDFSLRSRLRSSSPVQLISSWVTSGRLEVLAGDLSLDNFGLGEEAWNRVAEEADAILHNGALVHWVYPYEKLRAANVISTLTAIELASTGKQKLVVFVSSTSAIDTGHYVRLPKSLTDSKKKHQGVPESDDLKVFKHP